MQINHLFVGKKDADKDVDTGPKSNKKPDSAEEKEKEGGVPLSLFPKERTETGKERACNK